MGIQTVSPQGRRDRSRRNKLAYPGFEADKARLFNLVTSSKVCSGDDVEVHVYNTAVNEHAKRSAFI